MTDLADLSILQAGDGLRAGNFTAVDLLTAHLRRAAVTESHLHAYLVIDRDGAMEAARAADEALASGDDRPLLGIPVALSVSSGTVSDLAKTIAGMFRDL